MHFEKGEKSEVLAIVGNGFDLAHNYKTDYYTFSEKTIHPSLKYFKELCDADRDITTWYSFEENIKALTEKLFQKNYIDGYDFDKIAFETQNLKKAFQSIHELLIEYLKKEASTTPFVMKDSIKEIIDSNTIAFNFNYTSTIEKYTKNVFYIHGSLKENDILLGYDYRDEPCLAGYEDVYWSKRIGRENLAFRRFLRNKQNNIDSSKHNALLNCLEKYQTCTHSGKGLGDEIEENICGFEEARNIMNTIKENDYPDISYREIKAIVVLGHGIEADRVYLEGILQKCSNIRKVIIFRYEGESEEAFNNKISFFKPYCKAIESVKY